MCGFWEAHTLKSFNEIIYQIADLRSFLAHVLFFIKKGWLLEFRFIGVAVGGNISLWAR